LAAIFFVIFTNNPAARWQQIIDEFKPLGATFRSSLHELRVTRYYGGV
jgi:hypothetical protein